MATLCSDWPNWLHGAVTEAIELSDTKDWSTEQVIAYAIMAAKAEEREACARFLEARANEIRSSGGGSVGLMMGQIYDGEADAIRNRDTV